MDFTNAQTTAPVPRFPGAPTYGLGVLGAMMPARANTTIEYDPITGDPIDADGSVMCLTEVVPWPFAEDEIGVAFDQENLYGVRTRVWRRPLADGGGDKEWYTAVPKTLPIEYTAVTRCHIGYAQVLDYIGSDPMNGFTWNHRTPTGELLNSTTDPDGYRAQWTPMNLNDQAYDGGSFDQTTIYYVPMPPGFEVWASYRTAAIASNHIGFRGGKLTLTLVNNYVSYPISPSVTIHVGSLPVDSAGWTTGSPPGDLETYQSITISTTFTGFADSNYTQEFDLDELMPSPGIRHNFIGYLDPIGSPSGYQPPFIAAFTLSPRTDVPLPWFSSQRNRVAPGGIIVPP